MRSRDLQVAEGSVRRWRRAWQDAGVAAGVVTLLAGELIAFATFFAG